MHTPKVSQQSRKHVETHAHPTDEAQGSPERLLLIADFRQGVADVLEDAVTQLQQCVTGRRDPDPPAYAVKDRFAQLLLEQRHLPADGRLRDVELVASCRERAHLCNRTKHLELPQVHAAPYQSAGRPGPLNGLFEVAFVHLDAHEVEAELRAGHCGRTEAHERIGDHAGALQSVEAQAHFG